MELWYIWHCIRRSVYMAVRSGSFRLRKHVIYLDLAPATVSTTPLRTLGLVLLIPS